MKKQERIDAITKIIKSKFGVLSSDSLVKLAAEAVEEAIGFNEFTIKDLILDYDTKLNGSVLMSDEYFDFVRGLSKAISINKDIIEIKGE